MELIADQNKLKKDPIAHLLIESIRELKFENTNLYFNFPFYRGESKDDLVQAHVLFVSKSHGVIFFRCINTFEELTKLERKKLDDLDSHIFSKINKLDELRVKRRELKINVTPLIFLNSEYIQDEEMVNLTNLKTAIEDNKKDELSYEEFKLLLSVIEGTVHLRNKKDRELEEFEVLTKGKVLSIIQSEHATFDIEQKRAALNIIDSPQRIRGLAGSGKTIILTMKVALYHLQNPEAEILYTYFTKALYGQIKYLIEKYYRDFSDNREPDWDKIHILHGWGGRGLRGVYSDTCSENGIQTVKFFEAKRKNPKDPFAYVCESIVELPLKQKYDLTLIDEGQDFNKYFYRVCRKITKESRIVWAYDEFQDIFDINIQDEKETFGRDEYGEDYVDFSKNENELQDIVLKKCYRNSRIALLNAFSLGLGIYNERVLQRLEDNNHWTDLGFEVEEGDSTIGSKMIISRPLENSPVESNDLFKENSVRIELFDHINKECDFVVREIINDIRKENLRPDDICVISLDSKNIEAYFDRIQVNLNENGIEVFNLLKASNNNTYFNIENHVTLSTLNKAKGNETGMVYIVGTDSVFSNKDYIVDRNKLFTAITRSKGWVTITGYTEAGFCKEEMQKLKENSYKLVFTQPSKNQTKTILRGITEQQSFLNEMNRKIESFAKSAGISEEEVKALISSNEKQKNK
jgi:superfamily I DNA and RNA helicase